MSNANIGLEIQMVQMVYDKKTSLHHIYCAKTWW